MTREMGGNQAERLSELFSLEEQLFMMRFGKAGEYTRSEKSPAIITCLDMVVVYGKEDNEKKMYIGRDEQGRLTVHMDPMYVDPSQLLEISEFVENPPQKELRNIKVLLPFEISLSDLSFASIEQLLIYATPPTTFGSLTKKNQEAPTPLHQFPMTIEAFIQQMIDGDPSIFHFSDPTSGENQLGMLLKNVGFKDTGIFLIFREGDGVPAIRSAEHTFEKLVNHIIDSDKIYGPMVLAILAKEGQVFTSKIMEAIVKLRILTDAQRADMRLQSGLFKGRANDQIIKRYSYNNFPYAIQTANGEISYPDEGTIHFTPKEMELINKKKEAEAREASRISDEEKARKAAEAKLAKQKELLERKTNLQNKLFAFQLEGFNGNGAMIIRDENTQRKPHKSHLSENDLIWLNTTTDAPFVDFMDLLMRDSEQSPTIIHNTMTNLINFARSKLSEKYLNKIEDYEEHLPFIREVIKRLWLYSQHGVLQKQSIPGGYNSYDNSFARVYENEALELWKKYLNAEFDYFKRTQKNTKGYEAFRDVMLTADAFSVVFTQVIKGLPNIVVPQNRNK